MALPRRWCRAPYCAAVRCLIGRPAPLVAEVIRTIAELGERRILLRALREGIDNRYTHRASRSRSSNRGCAAEGGGGRSR